MNAERKQQTASNPFSVELCDWYCSANLLNSYNYDRAIIIHCDRPSSDWQVTAFTKFQRAAFYIFWKVKGDRCWLWSKGWGAFYQVDPKKVPMYETYVPVKQDPLSALPDTTGGLCPLRLHMCYKLDHCTLHKLTWWGWRSGWDSKNEANIRHDF